MTIPHWLSVLEWIQLALTLSFLVVMVGILFLVLRYHKLEFNGLWRIRAFVVSIAIMWAFSLLLGRHQLWSPDGGLLSTSSSRFEGLCRAHVFLTFGIWQPLFFLTILMALRSKEKSKLDLYSFDTNKFIIKNALLWCLPIFIVHIVIIAIGAVHESNPIVWATYTKQYGHCVIPILSTTAFAAFYCCFIIFYIISSRKLFKRLINHTLRNRIRWTQLFFIFFFPVEIVVRFIMIFISKYQKPYEALYHTYFFMDLIVCSVAVSELVLLPVLDAASYPLLKGVTAQQCKEYEQQEEARRKRKSTRLQPLLLASGASSPSIDKDKEKQDLLRASATSVDIDDIPDLSPRDKDKEIKESKSLKHVELLDPKSSYGISEDPPLKRTPSKRSTSIKSILSPSSSSVSSSSSYNSNNNNNNNNNSSSSNKPSESKPMLHPSSSIELDAMDFNETKHSSLHVKLPTASSYPTDLEDIFANIDDVEDGDGLENSSLKLKVDGIFINDDYPSSSSQR